MGLFSRNRRFDQANLERATVDVPVAYTDIWHKKEADPSRRLYTIRLAGVEETITRIRSSKSEAEARREAHAYFRDPKDALSVLEDVKDGRDDKLRALVIWEVHQLVFPQAVTTFEHQSGLTQQEFIETIEHEVFLQATCLACLRQLVTLQVWDALIDLMENTSQRSVVVPVLKSVRECDAE